MESTDLIEIGNAALARPGERDSGDRHLVAHFPGGVLVAVVDGLGHGREARAAADLAIAILKDHPQEPLVQLLHRCHESLRSTRGAVMSLASFNERRSNMTWIGVGNVEGVLLRANASGHQQKSLLLRGGVVGSLLRPPHPASLTLCQGDVLIFATDGVKESFSDNLRLNDSPQRMADQILERHGKKSDDALVLVARYLGRKGQ